MLWPLREKHELTSYTICEACFFVCFHISPSFLPSPHILLSFLPTFSPVVSPFHSFILNLCVWVIGVFLDLNLFSVSSQAPPWLRVHIGEAWFFPWTVFLFWHSDVWTALWSLVSLLQADVVLIIFWPGVFPFLFPWWGSFLNPFVHPENWGDYSQCHPAGHFIKFSGLAPYELKENINSVVDCKLV